MTLDLFAWEPPARPTPPPRPAAAPRPEHLTFPRRSRAWEDLLARATTKEVTIEVSAMWTGVMLERLSDPALGCSLLRRDGVVLGYPAYPLHGRTVLASAADALRFDAQIPLVLVTGRGTWAVTFRPSRPGERVPVPAATVLAELRQPETAHG